MKSSPKTTHQIRQWDGMVPSFSSIRGLIDHYPQAALIWDRPHNRIIMANQKFVSLTDYSVEDLYKKRVDELFTDSIIDELFPGVEYATAIKKRESESLPVLVNVSVLDPECHWWLLRFDDLEDYEQFVQKNLEVVFDNFTHLSRLTDYSDILFSIRVALKVAKSLLGTDYICIYNVKSGEPDISKIATIEKTQIFPRNIPTSDLIRLSKPMTWVPGSPIFSKIHRYALQAKFSYVTTIPLGNEKALLGLLVAGDIYKDKHKIKQSILELIGSQIGNALQHFILVETLRERIKEKEDFISVHDVIYEGSKEGIVILTKELNVLDISPTAELMLGYSSNEIHNEPVENILIGAERLFPALETACRGIATHDIGSVKLHRRNGQAFPAHIQILPVMAEEMIKVVIILIDDVSENEQIRLRTQQLEQRAVLGDFTAIFAHEVRNPINNISTGIQLLSNHLVEEDPNRDVVSRIQSDCLRLENLMESVLSFSRPLEPKMVKMDLGDLLKRMLERWRPRLEHLGIEYNLQEMSGTPKIAGDSRLLEQVFTNLISNAVDVMDGIGGTLAIKIKKSNIIANLPQVEVTISDSGPGIPPELIDRIFVPFVSNKPRGTGLGLAITKHIITAHRGNIEVESFPGGTVFFVHLPALIGSDL